MMRTFLVGHLLQFVSVFLLLRLFKNFSYLTCYLMTVLFTRVGAWHRASARQTPWSVCQMHEG